MRPINDLVEDDVRGKAAPEEGQWLRDPDNVQRWYDGLIELKNDIEAQMLERRAGFQRLHNQCRDEEDGERTYHEARAEYDTWRAGANRFKIGVERRIAEAKRLLKEYFPEGPKEKAELWDLIRWAANLIPDAGEGARWHDEAHRRGLITEDSDGHRIGATRNR